MHNLRSVWFSHHAVVAPLLPGGSRPAPGRRRAQPRAAEASVRNRSGSGKYTVCPKVLSDTLLNGCSMSMGEVAQTSMDED